MPFSAIVRGEKVVAPDLSNEDWDELKKEHSKGLPIEMICCGSPGHLRTSKFGRRHFYHAKKPPECYWEPETDAHYNIKYEIYQICKSAGWFSELEYRSDKWIADVYAEKDNRKIIFEVQLSKITRELLKIRDKEYKKAGIESYWLLNNKQAYNLNDYRYFGEIIGELPYVDNYWSSDPDKANPNTSEFFIPKDVIGFDIDLQTNLLNAEIEQNISVSKFVNMVLEDTVRSELSNIANDYDNLYNLRVFAKPILYDLEKLNSKRHEIHHKLKKQYAIFKTNSFENVGELQDNFRNCYACRDEIKRVFSALFSPKLGWVWMDLYDGDRPFPIFHLRSKEPLLEMQSLLKEVEIHITLFEKLVNGLYCNIELKTKNDAPNVPITRSSYAPPRISQNDSYRKIHSSTPIRIKSSTATENIPQHEFIPKWLRNHFDGLNPGPKNIDTIPNKVRNYDTKFEVFINCKENCLIGSDGMKYQIIPGLPIFLDLETAIEFEKQGYGYIVVPKQNNNF